MKFVRPAPPFVIKIGQKSLFWEPPPPPQRIMSFMNRPPVRTLFVEHPGYTISVKRLCFHNHKSVTHLAVFFPPLPASDCWSEEAGPTSTLDLLCFTGPLYLLPVIEEYTTYSQGTCTDSLSRNFNLN